MSWNDQLYESLNIVQRNIVSAFNIKLENSFLLPYFERNLLITRIITRIPEPIRHQMDFLNDV